MASDIAPCLIGIIGSTGSGKSSFVNAILGTEIATIGDGLQSLTADVSQYPHAHHSGVEVRIVDTPGLNEYRKEGFIPDLKVIQSIGAFLKKEYNGNQRLSGIIFLHKITAGKLEWQKRSMTLFKKLCGTGSLKNVLVVTTCWDEVDKAVGTQKERELQEGNTGDVLKELYDGGAMFVRSYSFKSNQDIGSNTFLSPHQILERVLSLDPGYAGSTTGPAREGFLVDAEEKPDTHVVKDSLKVPEYTKEASGSRWSSGGGQGSGREGTEITHETFEWNTEGPRTRTGQADYAPTQVPVKEEPDSWGSHHQNALRDQFLGNFATSLADAAHNINWMRGEMNNLRSSLAAQGQELAKEKEDRLKAQRESERLKESFQQSQASLGTLKESFDRSQANLVALQKSYEQIQTTLAVMEESEGRKQEECEALKDSLELSHADLKSTKELYEGNQAELETMRRLNERLQAELKGLKQSYESSESDLEAAKDLYARSQANLDVMTESYERSQVDFTAMKSSYEDNQEALKAMTQMYERSQTALSATQELYEGGQMDLKASRESHNQTQAELKAAKDLCEGRQKEIQSLTVAHGELEGLYCALDNEYNELAETSSRDKSDLQSEIESLRQRLQEAEAECQVLETRRQALDGEIERQQNEAKAAIIAAEASNIQIATLESRLQALRAENDQYRANLEQRNAQISALEFKVNDISRSSQVSMPQIPESPSCSPCSQSSYPSLLEEKDPYPAWNNETGGPFVIPAMPFPSLPSPSPQPPSVAFPSAPSFAGYKSFSSTQPMTPSTPSIPFPFPEFNHGQHRQGVWLQSQQAMRRPPSVHPVAHTTPRASIVSPAARFQAIQVQQPKPSVAQVSPNWGITSPANNSPSFN